MRDAERLLAGYAAGLLTEEERSRLFAAALRDQALFDALADEDALRELLEDPAARAKVLAALAEPAPVKVVPFYRRLPVLGAAASLMIALTAGLAYWRSQGLERLPRSESLPAPVQAAPAAPAAPKAETPVKPPEPQRKSRERTAPLADSRASAPGVRPLEEAVEEAPKPLPAAPPPPPARVAAGAAADKAETWAPERRKEAKKAAKREVEPADPAGSQAAALPQVNVLAMEAQAPAQAGASGPAKAPAPPLWTLERLEDGRLRIRVRWKAGHLYLLRRAAGSTAVLSGADDSHGPDGLQQRIYLAPAGPAALDLYLLPEPSPAPAGLPADGPLSGFRQRLRSE